MDYYCFPTKTGDISVFFDLGQYENSREKFFYQIAQEDVRLAKEKGKLLLFDLRTKTFVDCEGRKVDIKDKEIFPRCKIQESEELLEALEKYGGNSIVTKADSKMVENWFKYIPVKREFQQTTFGEVMSNLEFYENKYGKSFFLKTVEKQFSKVCYIMDFSGGKGLFAFTGCSMMGGNMLISDNSTPVLVTEELSVISDDNGKREWRVFVVNDKMWCISRSSDDLVEIEPYVIERVKEKIDEISKNPKFPSSYCVDFFEYDCKGETFFDICEFNSIESSGVYRNNDIVLD